MSHAKVFVVGAVLGAVVGAPCLGPILHLVLVGFVVASVALTLYHGRRLVLRPPKPKKPLEASAPVRGHCLRLCLADWPRLQPSQIRHLGYESP